VKTAPGTLVTLLNSTNTFLIADLYAITLFDGTALYWTSADSNLSYGGQTYTCPVEGGTTVPTITRGKTRTVLGLEVDELDVTLGQGGGIIQYAGIPLSEAALNGVFDGATVVLTRVFMAVWGDTSPGGVVLFSGTIAKVDPSSTMVRLTARSDLDKLLVQMPRNLFSPACTHTLFDPGCGLARASYVVTGSVTASPAPTTTAFHTTLTNASDYFQLGVIVMTSGAATGARAAIKTYSSSGGAVVLTMGLPAIPATGDTFQVIPGCDKTLDTCTNRFANQIHYRGFPWIPKPESAR